MLQQLGKYRIASFRILQVVHFNSIFVWVFGDTMCSIIFSWIAAHIKSQGFHNIACCLVSFWCSSITFSEFENGCTFQFNIVVVAVTKAIYGHYSFSRELQQTREPFHLWVALRLSLYNKRVSFFINCGAALVEESKRIFGFINWVNKVHFPG